MGGVQGQHGVHPALDLRLEHGALDQVVAQRAQQAQVERGPQPALRRCVLLAVAATVLSMSRGGAQQARQLCT